MHIRSERKIYEVLERHFRKAKRPLTCVRLMEIDEVRQAALAEFKTDDVRKATDALSNLLGHMWRRNLLHRYPAPIEQGVSSLAKYAYHWNDHSVLREVPPPIQPPTGGGKTGFIITENNDGVLIEFEKFMVLIKPKE